MSKEGETTGIDKVAFALMSILLISGALVLTVTMGEVDNVRSEEEPVDADGMLDTLLSSTLPEVAYTDPSGKISVYTGWTVHALLALDLQIREGEEANISSLEEGLEASVEEFLAALVQPHHYHMEISYPLINMTFEDLEFDGGAEASDMVHGPGLIHGADVHLRITV